MDKVATCSKPQFISIKISSWVLLFCLLAQVTGPQFMLWFDLVRSKNKTTKLSPQSAEAPVSKHQ